MTRHTLAHRYADEIAPPRHRPEPTRATRRDVLEILLGVPIMGALIVGIPLLLWLAGGA